MQVPIHFEFQSSQTFESFFPGDNVEIVRHLQDLAKSGQEQQIFIWGGAGSGKTHLLQACCRLADASGVEAFYLDLSRETVRSPDILSGLEAFTLVCLDNVQSIAGQTGWQHELFGFYNHHRQNNHRLLLAADCPPNFLPIELIDLKTRMNWGLTLKIQLLRDQQLIDALTHKAHCLGFEIPAAVGRFLLNHHVHDLKTLWNLLDKIDRATLAAHRKLTIPFLKQILADHDER